MISSLIPYEQDFSVRKSFMQLFEKQVDHVSINPWQLQNKALSFNRINSSIKIEVFIPCFDRSHRAFSFQRPLPCDIWLKTESCFIEKQDQAF